MECKHLRRRIWNRMSGWTEKCLQCGAKRYGKTDPPSVFRQFVSGMPETDDRGNVTIPAIEVTNSMGSVSYSEWRQ